MAKTVKTSIWAFMVMALAAMVGLAMTPLATAQQTNPQQQAQQGQSGQPVTATGCLQKASNGQGYELTDSSTNKTYDLTAASSDVDLSAHVGHTVTVTGTPSAESASGQAGEQQANPANPATNPAQQQPGQPGQPGEPGQPGQSGQQSGQAQQLSVTNIQVVSNSCSGSGGLL